MTTFTYAWEYRIEPGKRSEFLEAYGDEGDWVRLFSQAPGYLGTTLLHGIDDESRYMTLDRWVSKAHRDDFRRIHAAEFEQLDARCESFTREETFLGDFEEAGR